MRQGEIYIRLSDLLEGAPDAVLHSIAHILLAKLYRQPVDRTHSARYRRHVASHDVAAKARLVRQMRGRKHIRSARGHHYHLEEIFDDLNHRFFHGLLGRPQLTWSQNHARSSLGHYDPAHNAIVISRVFDHPRVPRYAVEYILFHEMLHLKHPVKLRGSRRCVHSREFHAEEKMFPELEQARRFLRMG
jgi:predicted metal-dependent hydrolase